MYNICINEIHFTWDNNKNTTNFLKHGISFEEASTVFYDDYAILFDDPDHSIQEERFLIIGNSYQNHLCIVSHCYRESDNVIRIISARLATRKERNTYEEQF